MEMNLEDSAATTDDLKIDVNLFWARVVVALTSCIILTITVIGGIMTSVH